MCKKQTKKLHLLCNVSVLEKHHYNNLIIQYGFDDYAIYLSEQHLLPCLTVMVFQIVFPLFFSSMSLLWLRFDACLVSSLYYLALLEPLLFVEKLAVMCPELSE